MKYCIDKYRIKVEIHLPPGTYVFRGESATGKTYLASLLKKYMTYGEPVNAYDYVDYSSGLNLTEVIQSGKYKVLLIDRYDMYYGEAVEALRDPPSDMIILIDTKRWNDVTRAKGACDVLFDERSVTVG